MTVTPVSEQTGLPESQLRFVMVWFLNFPLCWCIFYWAQGATARHLANFLIGFTCTFYFYGYGGLHVCLISTVTYLLLKYAPRERSQVYIMVFAFLHLSYLHMLSAYFNFGSYDLEITTNMMLTTLRMQALGYSYFDGQREEQQLTER